MFITTSAIASEQAANPQLFMQRNGNLCADEQYACSNLECQFFEGTVEKKPTCVERARRRHRTGRSLSSGMFSETFSAINKYMEIMGASVV